MASLVERFKAADKVEILLLSAAVGAFLLLLVKLWIDFGHYLKIYWPLAAGVGVFIGLVVVVMQLLKRKRRSDDSDNEGILAMDEENSPISTDEEGRQPIFTMPAEDEPSRRDLRSRALKIAGPLVVVLLVGWYFLSTVSDVRRSMVQIREDLGSKADTGLVSTLKGIVDNHQSTLDNHDTDIKSVSARLDGIETTASEAKESAAAAHGYAARVEGRVARLAIKVDENYQQLVGGQNAIRSELAAHKVRQDSINAFLVSKFPISPAEMDSLTAWFPKKQNMPN